jgi:hypothetical protein
MLRVKYLQRNHSTRTPCNLVFVDTETVGHNVGVNAESHTLRLGVAIRVRLRKGRVVRRSVYRFRSQEEWWAWLEKGSESHRPTWVFAHNAGFDLTILGLWEQIEAGQQRFKDPRPPRPSRGRKGGETEPRDGFAVTQDPPTLIRVWTRCGKPIVYADTLNWWRCSLRKLGESVDLHKYEMPSLEASEDEWFEYCERDVEITERAVLGLVAMVQEEDLGAWKGTAAAQAMAAYRHRWMQHGILIDQNQVATRLCRSAYFGGECRLSYQGVVSATDGESLAVADQLRAVAPPIRLGRVHVLDLQSAYPWAMANFRHPCKLEGSTPQPNPELLRSLVKGRWLAALVEIKSDGVAYPTRSDGKTEYVRGHFWSALCGEELRAALDAGHVLNVASCVQYQSADLFSEYVAYWWQRRQKAKAEGREAEEGLCKLFLNSLYGRFGMRSARWADRPDIVAPCPWGVFMHADPDTGELLTCRSIGWHSQGSGLRGEHPDALPAIPASVTAAVRVRMRQLRAVAGEGDVFYQDTDSLHVSDDGLSRLQEAGEVAPGILGALRVVEAVDRAWYRGRRNYSLDEREIVAGLKAGSEEVAPGVYDQLRFEGLGSLLFREPASSIRVTTERFTLRDGGDVGIVSQDGTVKPPIVVRPYLTRHLEAVLTGDEGDGDENRPDVRDDLGAPLYQEGWRDG